MTGQPGKPNKGQAASPPEDRFGEGERLTSPQTEGELKKVDKIDSITRKKQR
jgi:hypothetical protein